ncbi:hypothetical protein ASF41_13250 [Methylobacterium sp. Leaf111]|uniref:DNA-binding protein n=1 Tax=Methylobacterium sp. Leaf111 TaxID=1736257 RepID=UPI0006F7820D|nr:DNA-binding protein [Methylobacterium sp. Leaf111]KQP51147.1 hypothetical protein ASF41_13250 [Methylobacterium sp. Leaf111]
MDDARSKEFFVVADRLHAQGTRVSLRNVIPHLRKGGSNREIGPILRDWKVKRDYQPKLRAKPLPVPLQDELGKAAVRFWEAAQVEAARILDRDRANMAAELRAGEEVLVEALDRLDAAEAEKEALRARLAKVEKRLERVRAEEFWDAVMREVFELLPPEGAMTAEAILPGLRPWTVRAAALQHDALTVAKLREKMKVRVGHGWYFTVAAGGAFQRGKHPGTMRRHAGSS